MNQTSNDNVLISQDDFTVTEAGSVTFDVAPGDGVQIRAKYAHRGGDYVEVPSPHPESPPTLYPLEGGGPVSQELADAFLYWEAQQ